MQNPQYRQSTSEQPDALKESGFAPMRLIQTLFSKKSKFKVDDQPDPLREKGTDRSARSSDDAPWPLAAAVAVEAPKPVTAASSLCELLDSAPGSRNAFRHLASIEQSLQGKDTGGLFLFDWSADELTQALRQLGGLWMEPAPPELAELRAKMVDALAAQERREHDEAIPALGSFSVLSSFLVDEKMQVSDGRASDFLELSESWGDPDLIHPER